MPQENREKLCKKIKKTLNDYQDALNFLDFHNFLDFLIFLEAGGVTTHKTKGCQ